MANDSNGFPLQNAIVEDNNAIVEDDNFDKDDGGKIDWHQSHQYDTGSFPSVAITNDGLVVEVHKSENENTLWYHVGKVNGGKIDWHESHQYDTGIIPSVAITNDGLVVEVHKSENEDTLWYHVGKVNGGKIDWHESHQYDTGSFPSVAITNDGLVVEVHNYTDPDRLIYQVGKVKGGKIDWHESHQYDTGIIPSVAITNDGLVVEIHEIERRRRSSYQVGKVKGDKIDWHQSHKYDAGLFSEVAITSDGLVVEVHETYNQHTLQYRLGKVKGDKRKSHWNQVRGKNSYCRCACRSAGNNKEKHHSQHTMNVKKGAPYFYAVLTKDDDSIDFPTGAELTIEGSDGTKYDRDIEEQNKLVVMSGASVRCLIVKDPKPGDWKMTMTAPKGVGFHCECNTVPSKDVYDTIKDTLNSHSAETDLQPQILVLPVLVLGFIGLAIAWLISRHKKDVGRQSFMRQATGDLGLMVTAPPLEGMRKVKGGAKTLAQISKEAGQDKLGEILVMDANVEADKATILAYKQRKKKLYPFINASKYADKKTLLVGDKMSRSKVQTNLKKANVIYCTAAGHGLSNSLLGGRIKKEGDLEAVIRKEHYDSAEVQNKIFHFLACWCGKNNGIGKDLVKNGAKAFLGYSHQFRMSTEHPHAFCAGDIEIDLALLEGETVGKAYDRAIKKFDENIKRLRTDGHHVAASDLETDRDRLVLYGDKNAKL